ncbi:MAG: hypothetical protein MUF51_10750 [Vicinamibacteria bacterium]|jgi:hypothetical protein|nr:hypothetical protein [Vicinamibacteria bacterium]
MGIVSIVSGLLCFILAIIAWLPCLGWANWILWILPLLGSILSVIALIVDKDRRVLAGIGLGLNILALISCAVRGLLAIFFAGA